MSSTPPETGPEPDGGVSADPAALAAVAGDFGGVVHEVPAGVARPRTAGEVAAAVRFAAAEGLPLLARGAGHATFGQAQRSGALVVDTSALRRVEHPADDRVAVEAGARWSEVLAAVVPAGRTPPVLTDYQETTVGGTLSTGGVGGTSHRYGAQTGNVYELDVVTPDGTLVTCSADREPELFGAALAGGGRAGVIVRAVLRLVPAPREVRRFQLRYPDLASLAAEQRRLVASGRFDYVEGQLVAEDAGWAYELEVAAYDAGDRSDGELLAGLGHLPGAVEAERLGYLEFMHRLAPGEAYLRTTGEWFHPHPWWAAFLPGAAAERLAAGIAADVTPAGIGPSGVVLFYPMPTAAFGTASPALPAGPETFLLALLRTAPPDEPVTLAGMVAQNHELHGRVLAEGGTVYPIGTVPPPA